MNFLKRPRRPLKRWWPALVLVAILLLGSWSLRGRDLAVALGKPLWWLDHRFRATAASVGSIFRRQESLIKENQTLRREVAERRRRALDYELLDADNRYLHSVLGWRETAPTVVVARVLAGPEQGPEEVIIINRGRDNTSTIFQVGDLVTVDRSIALGRVVAVSGQTSLVKLFSAPGAETAVRLGERQIPATALGRGGGNFLITLPRGLEIAPASPVTMPAADGDLILGLVEVADQDSSGTLQDLLIRFPINLLELRYVEIRLADG